MISLMQISEQYQAGKCKLSLLDNTMFLSTLRNSNLDLVSPLKPHSLLFPASEKRFICSELLSERNATHCGVTAILTTNTQRL